jgi:hypothetical protein
MKIAFFSETGKNQKYILINDSNVLCIEVFMGDDNGR